MKHKISLFDRRRRGNPTTPTSPRTPWRLRRREEPRQSSSSQSDFNSIRVNTADYRSLDLLRQYDNERINVASVSQPTKERDRRPPTSSSIELERCPSEERNPRPEQNPRRRQDECLFVTSGYRVNTRGSPAIKEILSLNKTQNDRYDGAFPFSEQSREGVFLRGKGCLLILFIVSAFMVVIGLSWYYSCFRTLNKGSVHALVSAFPVARLLGLASNVDKPPDARNMWINHVVKNDDNQILIAETFESRLNAEITPLLEKYVHKIWDHGSSPPLTCHGEDRLMIAFSMAKAGSIPASITYETPCMNGPSSRSCVVKKQLADVRDLVVRLPYKSSRYMHAVRLEIDHTSKEDQRNSSGVRHIQDLGISSGQFRVELSDASRLALQRYCGQYRKDYSEDLMTEPVRVSNTRLINVYELKRLYGLLSSQSDTTVSGSSAWDTQMLSTVVVDPLEHSRHSMAPFHVQQLLSHLHRDADSQTVLGARNSRSPHITVSSPQEGELPRHSAIPSSQASERKGDVGPTDSRTTSELALPRSSPSPLSAPLPLSTPSHSMLPLQSNTTHEEPFFNFQPPPSQASGTKESVSPRNSSVVSYGDSPAARAQSISIDAQSPSTNYQTVSNAENRTADLMMAVDDEDEESPSDHENHGTQDDITSGSATQEDMNPTKSEEGEHTDNETTAHTIPPQHQVSTESSERSSAFQDIKTTEATPFASSYESQAYTRARRRSSAQIPLPHLSMKDTLTAPDPSQSLLRSRSDVLEQGRSLAAKLNKPTNNPSNRLPGGFMKAEKRLAAKPFMGTQRAGTEPTLSRGKTKQNMKNTGQGSSAPNYAIPSPTQMSLSSPAQVPTQATQRGLLPTQKVSTSTREGMSKGQHLNQLVKRSSSLSVGALSPTQKQGPTLYDPPSPAHRSLSGTQRVMLGTQRGLSGTQRGSPRRRGSLKSTGVGVSRANEGARQIPSGTLASKKKLKSIQGISSLGGAQPELRNSITGAPMVMRQPDTSTRSPGNLGKARHRTRSKPISVLAGLDSEASTQPLRQARKQLVRSGIP